MITREHVLAMARYNHWQNRSIYGAADMLTDEQRKEPRGAFFGSIHGTLNHLLFGDQIWLHRFAGTPKPKVSSIATSVDMYEDWAELKDERGRFDQVLEDWAGTLDQNWLEGDLRWFSAAAARELCKPRWLLVTHLFNHQTHHRGQVHCLLTQLGARPGDTDLALMPD